MGVGWKKNANQLEDECDGTNLQGKEGCDKLWTLQRSKVSVARHEDCRKGDRGENTSNGKSGPDAFWVYIR